jgi:hypothetical protein
MTARISGDRHAEVDVKPYDEKKVDKYNPTPWAEVDPEDRQRRAAERPRRRCGLILARRV